MEKSKNDYVLGIKILNRILIISIVVVFIYFFYDVFVKNREYSILPSVFVSGLYTVCLLLINFSKQKFFAVAFSVSLMILSLLASFFSLGGLNGISVLDICNFFVAIAVIFSGRPQRIFLVIYIGLIFLMSYVQLFHPEFIINNRADDDMWFNIVEVFCRCATAFNVGFAVKLEYDKENKHILAINNQLQKANAEVLVQNKEIILQQEEITIINESLEQLVLDRTKKLELMNEQILEFAFFNAHKVRGPLARILGLINISNLESVANGNKITINKDYFEMINFSAKELDDVIKEINELLSERDKILHSGLILKNRRKTEV